MARNSSITGEEHEQFRRVAAAFAELEADYIVVVDAARYCFVKLQYYTPPTGFENDYTFTDSRALFEDLWEEWLHIQLIALAKETGADELYYDDFLRRLPEEKKNRLFSRKQYFAKKAGIETE